MGRHCKVIGIQKQSKEGKKEEQKRGGTRTLAGRPSAQVHRQHKCIASNKTGFGAASTAALAFRHGPAVGLS